MKLTGIEAKSLEIPFKTAFRHASAERAATQTFWVEASAEGKTGYGEGCPREYVTGESLQSAVGFFSRHRAEWCSSVHDLSSLRAWSDRNQDDIERNPAAWAAVEIALLDLIGKSEQRSIESLLGLPELEGLFRYTAVLGDGPPAQFEAQLQQYLKVGFSDFKVKLAGERPRDLAKIRALTNAGLAGKAVRADANNLWESADAAVRDLEALQFPFCALEEPLRAGDYAGMKHVADALDTRIVLDESVLRAAQLDHVTENPERWIVNLRVSKMGGLLRSLALVVELRRRGLGLIIGAQVGETSVLTRAALTVANAARDILIAQEGAFGTHLLARDVVETPVMFGPGGVVDTDALLLEPAGLGLSVRIEAADLAELKPAN